MAYYEKVKKTFMEEAVRTFEQEIAPLNEICNDITTYFNSVEKSLKDLRKKGILELDPEICTQSPSSTRSSSLKENQRPNTRNNRTKRDVSTESSLSENRPKRTKQNNQISAEVNIKKERISKVKETSTSKPEIIKKEKEDMPAPTQLPPRRRKVKQERKSLDPKLPILSEVVSENRVTRSKMKKTIIRDSDVIIQSQPLPVLVISDSEEESASQTDQQSKTAEPSGSKRKSDKSDNESDNRGNKRSKSSSNDETDKKPSSNKQKLTKQSKKSNIKKGNKKASKAISNDELITDDESDFADSEQVSETINNKDDKVENEVARPIMDTTIVVKNPKCTTNALLNITVTVDNQDTQNVNSFLAEEKRAQELKDIMTDDDSVEENNKEKNVPKSNHKILNTGNKQKQLFSPFESSPVKKKVEAFERLGAENTMLPVRSTRLKTKALAKDSHKVDEEEQEPASAKNQDEIPKHNVREKLKVFTPTVSRFNPKVCSTSRLPNRHGTNAAANSSTSTAIKSASALKASQEEFRQREIRRHAKEAEALKKKEAMIQAQVEEKKRRREEKVMKAQQQREAIEKQSMKKVEAQKIKDERHRQLLLEREEKLKKQKAEHDRKMLLAKQKAAEEKRKDEEKKKEEEKRAKELAGSERDNNAITTAQAKKEPIYLTCRPPRLPTTDCYDSDEPGYENRKYPSWTNDIKLQHIQLCLQAVGSQVRNTLYCCQAQTPDLQDIFQNIDPVKLKRTSSAHWRVPPRYTLMCSFDSNTKPIEESIIEGSDEDSD